MSAMDCRDVREALETYIAGELDPRSAAQVAGHLESCAECAREHGELLDITTALRRTGQTLRPLLSFVPTPAAPAPRTPSRRRLAVAGAVVLGAWAAVATLVATVPQVSTRLSFLPVGHQLQAARSAATEADQLRAANLLLQRRLTAQRLNAPLGAVIAADELAASLADELAEPSAQRVSWSLGAVSQPFRPPGTVTFDLTVRVRRAAGEAPRRTTVRIGATRADDGTWTATVLGRQ